METYINQFNQIVALFLSEILRSRRTSLGRAAEISERLVGRLLSLGSEEEALGLVSEMEKDFEELAALKQVLRFGYKESDVKIYEREIKEYAARLSEQNVVASARFLQEAAHGRTIQHLCVAFPEFCGFLLKTDKAPLLGEINSVPEK